MHQRHRVVGLAAVCLAGLFAGAGATSRDKTSIAATQNKFPGAAKVDESCLPGVWSGCKKELHLNDPLPRGGREKGGLVYFRIAYDDVEPRQLQAFKMGMALWNKHSEKTGFVFEDETPGKPDFKLQKGAPPHLLLKGVERTKCAEYVGEGPYIWYSPQAMSEVLSEAGIEAAARVYAHELGHVLNLCHKPGSCLMRKGDSEVDCYERAAEFPLDIPADDVRDARKCGRMARENALKKDEAERRKEQERRKQQTPRPVPRD